MAKKLSSMYTPDEYVRLIIAIADYVIENKASTRSTAKYFTDKGIKISNNTVFSLLNGEILKISAPKKFEKVQEILNSNLSRRTFTDENVLIRMSKAFNLLLQGYTVSQIAKELDTTEMVVYRDLTSRLEKLEDKELMKLVSDELKKHKMDNLKHGNKKH